MDPLLVMQNCETRDKLCKIKNENRGLTPDAEIILNLSRFTLFSAVSPANLDNLRQGCGGNPRGKYGYRTERLKGISLRGTGA